MKLCRVILLSALLAPILLTPSFADDDAVVNGYTFVAPSIYPSPPMVVYDPFFAVPTQTAILPLGYSTGIIYAEPAFVSQTIVPYNPTWLYAPVSIGPSAYRQQARFGRYGAEYDYREYVPGRAAPVYSYRINSGRRGVRIRERFR